MVGPLVVGEGSDITAVEQRVVVQSVALGRAIHPYPGSTIPYHVVIHDKVLAVVVEVDLWAKASVVVNPIVGNARAFPVTPPHMGAASPGGFFCAKCTLAVAYRCSSAP